ncbi:MAG: protein TolR [Proteobacteria bacterium]|jgi:biopolymer transport protein TolR|nr:protein TolR [Desulfocapsa sp.]MBU3944222.1 protein TolR [Pseudomonadota bacterium]MCG2743799.1 protein TolR [Desulfobacteraceae bacterium]MDO8946849.1 protein TolR [Desulfocapsaceae bacterium]MBU3982118.1 protein TolR [Pseudomonadota bacterium]
MGMGSSRGNGTRGLVADINVTPLVDVMLVLLIIFMITAPMMTQGLDVDLPETTANSLRQKEDPQVVSVDKDGKIMLGKIEYTQPVLRDQLAKIFAEKGKEELILLKADKNITYGEVASIMADIKAAGFTKLGMVTKPSDEKK